MDTTKLKEFLKTVNVEQDTQINKFQIDAEAVTLPHTYHNYADAASDAKTLVSEKSDNLKVILAERQLSIREKCATEGKKVTEAVIAAMVDVDADVNAARKELRDAQAVLTRLSAIVSAMEIKKSEIDNLTRLYCSGYYADSKTEPDKDFKSDMLGTEMRKTMNPLP